MPTNKGRLAELRFLHVLKTNHRLNNAHFWFRPTIKICNHFGKGNSVDSITDMEIYLVGNRMFMIMEVDETYDPAKKAAMDAINPKVQEWEQLMWDFQQALPWAKDGEK